MIIIYISYTKPVKEKCKKRVGKKWEKEKQTSGKKATSHRPPLHNILWMMMIGDWWMRMRWADHEGGREQYDHDHMNMINMSMINMNMTMTKWHHLAAVVQGSHPPLTLSLSPPSSHSRSHHPLYILTLGALLLSLALSVSVSVSGSATSLSLTSLTWGSRTLGSGGGGQYFRQRAGHPALPAASAAGNPLCFRRS